GIGGAKLAGFANAVLRKIVATGALPLPEEGRARVEVEHSLAAWIVDELEAAVEREPDGPGSRRGRVAELAAALNQPAPLVGRANLRRTTRDTLLERLRASGATAEPIDDTPAGFRVDGLGDPSRDPAFAAGEWTVQDTGAQRVGALADPKPGQRILDACAGVGGKSTHLAELTGDAASIDAADQSATKLGLLRETQARLGLRSIATHVCDLTDPA